MALLLLIAIVIIVIDLYVRISGARKTTVDLAKAVNEKLKEHEERIEELESNN